MNAFRKLPFSLGSLGAVAAVLASGCYTAKLDPDLAGAFACELDDEDSPCPAGQACVNGRCEDSQLLPSLKVIDPEAEQIIERLEVIDLGMGMPGLVPLEIQLQGSLSLVSASAGADPVFGEGHVKVFIDGQEQVTIDDGSIDGSTIVMAEVPAVAGAHRIVLQAYRNDGEAYDNPEATATRLFWLVGGVLTRPFVAITSPWPGTVFDLELQDIDVEVATLDFMLRDPGGPPQTGVGHAHLYYDPRVPFPECANDPGCEGTYLGVAGESRTGTMTLPEADEGDGSLSVMLRNTDHSPYRIPFDCDPMQGPLECASVFDTITIKRLED